MWVKLYKLYLSHNQLSGSILKELGYMVYLQYVDLSCNNFSGNIPSSFGNFHKSALHLLKLDSNQLSGNIPPELGKISGWWPSGLELDLSHNQLSGSIPKELGKIYELGYLRLNNNQLIGSIPKELGKITYLLGLDLSNNQLTGRIPPELGNYTYGLKTLKLNHNQLSDSIPPSLGNLVQLKYLFLSDNKLTGNIPSSFSKLTRLISFHAGYNRLGDTAPAFLATLPRLRKLGLAGNNYTFDGLEELAQHDFDTFKYLRQHKIEIHQYNNTLSVYAGGTLSNNTYKWYRDGALIATTNGDSTYTPTASGAYTVQVTNAVATQLTLHSDTITVNTLRAAAQNTIAAQTLSANAFSVYPNPASTNVTISFSLTGKYVLSLTDMKGALLQTKTGIAARSTNTVRLDISRYSRGAYFITLVKEKGGTQSLILNKQ